MEVAVVSSSETLPAESAMALEERLSVFLHAAGPGRGDLA